MCTMVFFFLLRSFKAYGGTMLVYYVDTIGKVGYHTI